MQVMYLPNYTLRIVSDCKTHADIMVTAHHKANAFQPVDYVDDTSSQLQLDHTWRELHQEPL